VNSASIEAFLAQGRAAWQAGEVDEAVRWFRSTAEAPDASAAVFLELAEALWASFEFEEALHALEEWMRREPANPTPAILAAKRLFTLGRLADCARFLNAALERQPADATLRRMLAEVRDREGQFAEAETLAREALAQNPRDALAARSLAHTLRRAGRVEEAREVLSRQLREHPGPEDWRLNYELAACLDCQADYAGAMAALQRAKAQLRPMSGPLLAQWQARARRREEFANALDRSALQRWQAAAREEPKARRPAAGRSMGLPSLAILAGHPRSGTTLLEQMLAAHSGVVTTDETGVLRQQFIEPIVLGAASTQAALREVDEFDADQLAAGRAVYFRATTAHLGEPIGARLLIEKDPLATQDLGFILRLLPESRVIFPSRDPRDVCVSFFFTLVPLNADSAPALDFASTCASMALSLRLWRHWRRVLPQPWVEVRYERLVREPERAMQPVAETLGLQWKPAMLAPAERKERGVRSPTYADVAQPLHTRAIGRWRHYAQWLEPHLGPLREVLKGFGYE
jgi:tetratricopeptide (TPR) repeat protein